jgi:hypothetical protein
MLMNSFLRLLNPSSLLSHSLHVVGGGVFLLAGSLADGWMDAPHAPYNLFPAD